MIHAITKEIRLDAEFILSTSKIFAGVLWKITEYLLMHEENISVTYFF